MSLTKKSLSSSLSIVVFKCPFNAIAIGFKTLSNVDGDPYPIAVNTNLSIILLSY
jgi:hypothetical protein